MPFQIHAENLNCISEGDIFGCEFLLRFLLQQFAESCLSLLYSYVCADSGVLFPQQRSTWSFWEFVEHLHSLVCIFLLRGELHELLIGLTDDAVSLLVQLLLLGFHFHFREAISCLYCSIAAFIFNSYTAAFQGTENIFERFILFTDLFFGLIDDIVRSPSLEEMANALLFRNTDQQAVGRAERFHVKFAAGIFYT